MSPPSHSDRDTESAAGDGRLSEPKRPLPEEKRSGVLDGDPAEPRADSTGAWDREGWKEHNQTSNEFDKEADDIDQQAGDDAAEGAARTEDVEAGGVDARDVDAGKQLMLDFQKGDERAFDEIVRRFQEPVKHFLHRYLRDRHRTEDLTQEVFIRVYRSRERYQPSARFRTWLFTIATRLGLNEIRGVRRRRRVFAEIDDDPDDSADAPWQSAADHREPSPETNAESAELDRLLGELIDQLPANQRAAVLLSRVHDLPYRDIAEALDVSVMAVKSLLMRARETLRRRIERYLEGKPLSSSAHPSGAPEDDS